MHEYDIILFGVTGFTGKYLLEHMVNYLKNGKGTKFTYAIAARSVQKMDELLQEVSISTGVDLSRVPKISADVYDQTSLVKMASQGKIVLNCVGPIFTGKQEVVDACIESGTHLVDLIGAPLLVERVQRDCDIRAKKSNVYIVNSCGFDSIPVDMGVVHLIKNFGGDVNGIESYLEIGNNGKLPKLHFATFESIVHGMANASQLKPIRKALFNTEPKMPDPKYKLCARFPVHHNEIVGSWCLLYPRNDVTVVARTQHLLYRLQGKRPVQLQAYMKVASLFSAFMMALSAVFLGALVFFPFGLGRRLLLKFPELLTFGFVTREGPSKEEMEGSKFTITLAGKGWSESLGEATHQHGKKPDKQKIVKVTGGSPAYGATSVCMLQAAITLLLEREKMPSNGGVFTPGAAFANTQLVQRLHDNGVKFEILQ